MDAFTQDEDASEKAGMNVDFPKGLEDYWDSPLRVGLSSSAHSKDHAQNGGFTERDGQ